MKTNAWLARATRKLTQAGIGTARLDCLVLLEDVTRRDRAWLLAHPEQELSSAQVAELEKLLAQRARHEPLAYVRGRSEFYGRTFKITPAVLDPRPESETMIDALKAICAQDWPQQKKARVIRIADVGTGSGALGITAALEVPNARLDLLEIDENALQVAKTNVDLFTLNISVIESDLLAQSTGIYDVLLCNLPYVPDNYTLNKAALLEPKIAIFGGPDGLDVYRKLFEQVRNLSKRPLYILSEALPFQHEALRQIAEKNNYTLLQTDDFIQVFQRAK